MGKYYLHKDGVLHATGVCQDGMEAMQAYGGYQVCLGDPPGYMTPAQGEAPYQVRRRQDYPSTGEQLDALWHAMEEGLLPKVEPFFSDIAAVKARHPKQSN
jgi:hypothetical protein